MWDQAYDSSSGRFNLQRVAVDRCGDVVVPYFSQNADGFYEPYVGKYAAANGALIWEKRYSGGPNSDYLAAVAADRSGNVVVAGSFWSESNNRYGGYRTAKYAGTDGTLLWEKLFRAPAAASASANGLALGPNGMVAVIGNFYDMPDSSSQVTSFVTVVYQETLPPLSIEIVSDRMRLGFVGAPGSAYDLQRADAITGHGQPLPLSPRSRMATSNPSRAPHPAAAPFIEQACHPIFRPAG